MGGTKFDGEVAVLTLLLGELLLLLELDAAPAFAELELDEFDGELPLLLALAEPELEASCWNFCFNQCFTPR